MPASFTMLAHLAQASRRPQRSWLAFVPRRSYAEKADGSKEDPFKAGPSFNRWLREEGAKFKDPRQPKNWLGGQVVEFVLVALVLRGD